MTRTSWTSSRDLASWTSSIAIDKSNKYHLALDKWLCLGQVGAAPSRTHLNVGKGQWQRTPQQISEAIPRDEREVVARKEPAASVAAVAAAQVVARASQNHVISNTRNRPR